MAARLRSDSTFITDECGTCYRENLTAILTNQRKMKRMQFSISSLVLLTTLVAGLCAAFPNPKHASYVLIAFLVSTTVLARLGLKSERRYWTTFSLVGWVCFMFGFSCLDAVERTSAYDFLVSWLLQHPRNWGPSEFLFFAHTLVAICGAFVGATLTTFVSFLTSGTATTKVIR